MYPINIGTASRLHCRRVNIMLKIICLLFLSVGGIDWCINAQVNIRVGS